MLLVPQIYLVLSRKWIPKQWTVKVLEIALVHHLEISAQSIDSYVLHALKSEGISTLECNQMVFQITAGLPLL